MEIILNDGQRMKVSQMKFNDWRHFMQEFLSSSSAASKAWDTMSCVRGPDTPSERPDMDSSERDVAYRGRRQRKYKTIEVLRHAMFFGTVGGSARSHKANHVTLPDTMQHEHFDRHVVRGAAILDIEVKYED